jgi:hypothetical protein
MLTIPVNPDHIAISLVIGIPEPGLDRPADPQVAGKIENLHAFFPGKQGRAICRPIIDDDYI